MSDYLKTSPNLTPNNPESTIASPRRTQMELKQKTVETLLDMDEPEAMLRAMRNTVERKAAETGAWTEKRGYSLTSDDERKRWQTLALVLAEAEIRLDQILNARPAGPDFTKPAEPKPEVADEADMA